MVLIYCAVNSTIALQNNFCIYIYMFNSSKFLFLSATWLPHSQLWTKETTSLTQYVLLCYFLAWWSGWVPKPKPISYIWTVNLLILSVTHYLTVPLSLLINSRFNFFFSTRHLNDCMFLSRHVHVLEWIYVPECQETPCLKQAQYLKFKCLQQDSNPQPFSL